MKEKEKKTFCSGSLLITENFQPRCWVGLWKLIVWADWGFLDRALKQQKNGFYNTIFSFKDNKKEEGNWLSSTKRFSSFISHVWESKFSFPPYREKITCGKNVNSGRSPFSFPRIFPYCTNRFVASGRNEAPISQKEALFFVKVLVHLGSELVGAVRTGSIFEVNTFECVEYFFWPCSQPTTENVWFSVAFFPAFFCSLHYVT